METSMSKTTDRYGKPTFVARIAIDANPKPTNRMRRQERKWNECAEKAFGKPYAALTDRQKTQLHYDINTGKFDEKD